MLNKVTLIGTLAIVPEMGLTDDGSPYSLFSFRIFTRDRKGNVTEEYVKPLCYGEQAEYLVRDCMQGDTLLIEGSLSVSKWTDRRTGEERQALNVIADNVEKLASGNGTVPPPTLKDMEAAVRTPFESGEETIVSTVTFAKQGATLNFVPQRFRFPQPLPDGTYRMPPGKPGKLVARWLDDHGLSSLEYTLLVNANEQATKNTVSSKLVSDAKRYANMMVPFFIEPRAGIVKIPGRRSMRENEYYAKVRKQHEFLAKQVPSFREQIIREANKVGVAIEGWWYGVPAGQTKMAFLTFFDEAGRLIYPKTRREAIQAGAVQSSVASNAAFSQTRSLQQTNANDWYQDQKTGEWRMK